ncbi:glycosyl hydrolase family 20 [Herbihabitans rhizosphaerae]|uniref:Glycosyl hydrolase family 20 n=1 Tax=Herbihabitans rhizosphaerae TaxID=1872711 RepID=A0A4Q7KFE3_9PSEU|nr:beta-N-acetylglucosaminidase domain-containing protein [Herbihabitans rhizosphaerae]RZS32841.1 glycosyl hydrolase family 20 [Herbihabitans rhizosphaerae]
MAPVEATVTPRIHPTPAAISMRGEPFPVTPDVGLVTGARTDTPAVAAVRTALASAGFTRVTEATESDPGTPVTVWVGGPAENAATAGTLDTLGVRGPAGLRADGYVLASGRDSADREHVVLAGVDGAGTFYAAQSLRQLLTPAGMPSVEVRDEPSAEHRGTIEGFYGQPWSHADRLDQMDFYGRTKQNIYVYAPKDDPYHREKWREPYPPAELARLKELVDRAAANHVGFTFALSPGLSICYSSDADLRALVDKFESLYGIGVRQFNIPLDDISYDKWNCVEDEQKFGPGSPASAGAAQSFVLNRVKTAFNDKHPDVSPLQTVATEYYDIKESAYKKALREQLDPSVLVQWTGIGVIAPTITTADARAAREVFGHKILVWDNYPVNDYVKERLLLGPYVGREPGITTETVGVTANPMNQAQASKIALHTSADFLWNAPAYDPARSWEAAIADLGGTAANWLRVFAENSHSSRIQPVESATLTPLIAELWRAFEQNQDVTAPAAKVNEYFGLVEQTPARLAEGLANPRFLTETKPWLDKFGAYGAAGKIAADLLVAYQKGDTATVERLRADLTAKRDELHAIPQVLAPGVFDPFLDRALRDTGA